MKVMKYNFLLFGSFFRFFLIFVLIAGWIFSGFPQIWQNPQIPPEVEKTEAASVKTFGDRNINFFYTDDNSGENLIIKTDNKTYAGLTRADVYFSVTNTSDKPELVNFQVHFSEDKGKVKKIEKWTEKVPYEIDAPEYGPKTFICEEDWQEMIGGESGEALGQYQCQSTEERRNCDSLSEDGQNCYLDKVQIGSHKETKYKDAWQNIELSDKPLSIQQGFFEKLLNHGIKQKQVPNNFRVEKSTANDGYLFQPDETQYFKAEIQFPPNSSGEFYIEAMGDKKGYGLLDPWWDSGWLYKKPITITYSGSALTDYQVKIVADTVSLISAGKMQSDCDDIRMIDSNEGAGDELDYWIDSDTCNTASTFIWVEVPSITANKTIYMYYGNSLATEGKNGANTFIFFDDFPGTTLDGTKWTATYAAGVTVNNGVTITAGDIYTNSTATSSPQNKTIEMKAKFLNGAANYSGINIANAQSTQGSNTGSNALAYNMTQSGAAYNLALWGANGTAASYNIVSGASLGTPTLSTDYIIGFSFFGSSQLSYFYQSTSYTDVNRLTYSGTWNVPFYLWLGYFTGNTAGSTDIDDITARWVRIRQYSSTEPTTEVGSETGYANVFATGFGTQSSSIVIPSTNQHVGGGFSIDSDGSRNVTGITITEHGTVNAQTNLANVKLYYDLDISAPYDCAGESYGGTENQFGSTATFNGTDGTASFTGSVGISTTQTMCVYVVLDVGSGAGNNETLEIKINNPSTDVMVSSGTVGPTTAVEISGTTTLNTPSDLQQIHYRWRNDDGGESGNDPIWWNSSWSYRKKITIDQTKIDEDLTNFPVLISLASDTDLAADAQDDGDDIVFTDASSNKLDHEIEKFDGGTGELIADVKVPSISGSVNTDIYIYYGNLSATNQQNKTGVWSNGFSMVYHLNEPSGTTGSGSVDDATDNTNGTPSTGMSFGQSGKIASSTNFSAATGINAGSLGAPLLTAETTISFWIYATNYASPARQNPFNQAYGGWGTMTLETGGQINWYFGSNGGDASPYIGAGSSAGLVSNSAWIYITAVRDPSGPYTYKWYKNGAYLNGSTYSSTYPVINTRTFTIGDGYVNPINGKMDEFRVSSAARSAAWIKAEYENQNSPSAFYNLYIEEAQGTAATFTLNEDTAMTGFAKATVTRLRIEISNEGGQTASDVAYRLEVSEPNPATCAAGSYERVSTDTDWEMTDSTYFADGASTQNVSSGLTDENTTFVSGQLKDTGDQTSGITLTNTEFTEIEYSIRATTTATDGATYCFRVTNAGTVINTYTVYPEITIAGLSSAIEIRAQNYTTSVSTITFPEAAPETTVSQPYNNIDDSGSPQTFGGAGTAKPVVTLYNGGASTLTIWYNITTFTNSIVSSEYYLVNNKAAACLDASCITNAATFDVNIDTGTTIAAGAGNEKDFYLKINLSAVAGKTGNSTLTILGESL